VLSPLAYNDILVRVCPECHGFPRAQLATTPRYYSMIALTLNAFGISPDAGVEALPV
jgi:hypothetical protein